VSYDNESETETTSRRESDLDAAASVASYVAARIFNRVALPPQLSEAMKDLIEARAERELALPGPANFDMTARDAKEKREKEADDHTQDQLGWIQQEQQREREEWARTSHSFGTTKMTGAEWKLLSEDLKDGALRQWLIARLMKDGKTEAQAERKADEIADIATIMAKPESQRTPAEHAKMHKAEQDPEFQRIMPELAEQRRGHTAGLDSRGIMNGDQTASTTQGADLFASAPDLTSHHRAALAAEKPLDLPREAAAPLLSREAAPIPAASAGLDL
jgi:phage terminase small subunit